MKQETVTITKEEYDKLKKTGKIDWELVESFKRGLEDLKQGKVKEWKREDLRY